VKHINSSWSSPCLHRSEALEKKELNDITLIDMALNVCLQ